MFFVKNPAHAGFFFARNSYIFEYCSSANEKFIRGVHGPGGVGPKSLPQWKKRYWCEAVVYLSAVRRLGSF